MEGIKSDLQRVNELIGKLEKGELEMSELLYLTDAARALYEKAVILKYKAFEKEVRQDSIVVTVESEPEQEVEKEVISTPVMEEEEPSFDFGIFDANEPEAEELPEDTGASSVNVTEPIAEPEVEEHLSVTTSHNDTEEGASEEVTITQTRSTFYDKLNQVDNSLAARIAGGKLDTLIGAFGLNQRLQFINELFDGSSDMFSEAIKSIDSQSNLENAKQRVDQYAKQFEWDPNEETVQEFIAYVNRRYA